MRFIYPRKLVVYAMGDWLVSGVVTPAVLNGEYRPTGIIHGKLLYTKVGDVNCQIG